MKYNYYDSTREGTYMVVKKVSRVEEEGKEIDIKEPEYTYFRVLSDRYLKGLLLRMCCGDFEKYFHQEMPSMKDSDYGKKEFEGIYRSRDWIFPEKVKWWNENIEEVISSYVDDEAYIMIYTDLEDKYCTKFKINKANFRAEMKFFDALLTDYRYCSKSGKLIPKDRPKRKGE